MSLTILALDAAGAACSAALWRDGRIAAHRRRPMQRGHAEALMPLLLEVLAEAGHRTSPASGRSPSASARAASPESASRSPPPGASGLPPSFPCVGVDSFSAVAAALPEPPRPGETLLVVIDSKREALFGQYYDDALTPLGEPHVLKPEALLARRPPGPLLIAGDGAHLLPAAAAARIADGRSGRGCDRHRPAGGGGQGPAAASAALSAGARRDLAVSRQVGP